MFNPNDEVIFRLPAGEIDELIISLQRSIKWQQQIISKVLLQAQAQQEPEPQPQPQPAPSNGGTRRGRSESAG